MKRNSVLSKSVIAATLSSFVLMGCQTTMQDNPKQTIGTILGASLGGLVGASFGGGKGKLAAVAVGVLAGAYFGSEVGKSLDATDKAHMDKNAKDGLEYSKSGATTAWRNPDSGNSGTFTPTKTYSSSTGENCREFETTIIVDGKEETATGQACREANGEWKVMS
jgi:surface antigen